jgi:hypothetical protein
MHNQIPAIYTMNPQQDRDLFAQAHPAKVEIYFIAKVGIEKSLLVIVRKFL